MNAIIFVFHLKNSGKSRERWTMRKYMLIGLFVASFLFFRVLVANAEITIQQPGSAVAGKTIGELTADWW